MALPLATIRPTVQPSRAGTWPTLATASTSMFFSGSSTELTNQRWIVAKGISSSPFLAMRHSILGPVELNEPKLSQAGGRSPDGG